MSPPPPGKGPDDGPPGKGLSGGVSWREYDWLDPERIGRLLVNFGEELEASGQLELNDMTITPESPSYFEGRKERGPGGEERLIFEIEWKEKVRQESEATKTEIERRIAHGAAASAIEGRDDDESPE